jgi:hypothetical protein
VVAVVFELAEVVVTEEEEVEFIYSAIVFLIHYRKIQCQY